MVKPDKQSDSTQERRYCRERVACLKKIVGIGLLKAEVRRRNLEQRASRKCPAEMMVLFVVANVVLWRFGLHQGFSVVASLRQKSHAIVECIDSGSHSAGGAHHRIGLSKGGLLSLPRGHA